MSNPKRKGRLLPRRRSGKTPHEGTHRQPIFTIERLLARSIALAALDQDYSAEITLARSLARAEERRVVA